MTYHITDSDLWDLGEFDSIRVDTYYRMRQRIKEADLDLDGYRFSSYFSHFAGKGHAVWHHDDDQEEVPEDEYLAIWVNQHPTELKKPRGRTVYALEPMHLYLMDNRSWLHRAPPSCKCYYRTFFRIFIPKVKSKK